MNSCGNSNISTRLRGSKCAETPDESINQIGEIEKEGSGVISGYSINELNVPRSTLVICQRNSNYSSDHGFTRFKPRFSFISIISCPVSYRLMRLLQCEIFVLDSAVFQEMNFEWRVAAALQIVPGVGRVGEPSRRSSTIANQTQSPATTLHLDPSFKNR